MNLPTIRNVKTGQPQVFTIIAAASIVSIFCLASTKVLLSQAAYKRHIVNARHAALNALNEDLKHSNDLISQYENFQGTSANNIIGGRNVSDQNAQPPDGDNARIVLNALPSTYDFPALITSVSKILSNNSLTSISIGGTDQSDTVSSKESPNPQTVSIPITVAGSSNYAGVQSVVHDFERSIRPFDVTVIQFEGSNDSMNFSASYNTYFQPAKTLNITEQVVK